MSFLINRNPPARLQCLHGLCKMILNRFGTEQTFRMSEIKYDPNSENIHSYCELLIRNTSLNINYCPYKENPLNTSGCSLTNGISDDTTKSKEVSNTVNALHALGFLIRRGNSLQLSLTGKEFSLIDFTSPEMLPHIRKAVLKYGLFVGFMFQLSRLNSQVFNSDEISVGYPRSNEKINLDGEIITLSSGSENDSNTRTKSCILAWAISAGFISPISLLNKYNPLIPHVTSSEYILKSNRNERTFKILDIPTFLFNGSFISENPLDYKNLTKNIGALRENNQKNIRDLTLKFEPKIQNRRFAICYLLNEAFKKKKLLSFTKMIEFLSNYDLFIIDKESFYYTMSEEINIAFIAGIPFDNIDGDNLKPLVGLNIDELTLNAPMEVINALNKYSFL